MRILHVIPAVAPRYGGPSSAIAPMCLAVAALGHDVTIAATDADGPGRLGVPLGAMTSWQGVPAIFFTRNISEAYKYSRALAAWLRVNVGAFDVVHIHAVLSHAPIAAAAACRRAAVPYIVRPLGTIAPWSLGRKAFRKRLLLAVAGGRMLRNAAAIHYTTREEREEAERTLGIGRGVVIPIGLDQRWLEEPVVEDSARDKDRYVLVLSRLHPKKNLEALIDGFADARAKRPAWRLVIAGDGDEQYVRSLHRLVRDRAAAEFVTFTGWVDGDRKSDLIRRASLFALPSLHENFGVSVLEALAAGVPAFVSRGVHLSTAVHDANAGWVVDLGLEPTSLRRMLEEALDDDKGRAARGRAARSLSQGFAWPRIGAQLIDLYGGLAKAAAGLRTAAALPPAIPIER